MSPVTSLKFPIFVKWYITGDCNLRCSHCYLSEYNTYQDYKLISPIINFLGKKKIAGIAFLGGEPLLRKDMPKIIKPCSKNIYSSICTNATLLNSEVAKSLKASQIGKVQVSIEGSNKEINDNIRGRGTFERATSAMQLLVENGIYTTVAYTLNKNNFRDIEGMFYTAPRLC